MSAGHPGRALRYALLLAGGYAVLSGVYIVFSSAIAARLSGDVEQLREIETFKGVMFVAVTALAVFLGAWVAVARIERHEAEVRHRDRALLANERRAFAGLLAASTAHDANNVLVAVISDLEGLRHAIGAEAPALQGLQRSVDKLIALNRRLLSIVRQGAASSATDVDVSHEIQECLAVVRSHTSARRCALHFDPTGPLPMRVHPLLVHQIVGNLLVNACEATDGRGTVEVRLARDPSHVTIEVHDDGPGVPTERRPGIFDALETTKADGSGLGLFSVKSCAQALGGAVDLLESPLGGACFRVRLPLANEY